MKVLFIEDQRFNQWWLWLILIGFCAIPGYGIYKQLIMGEPFGDKPMSDTGLIITSILIYALLGFFRIMRLKTEIDENEIRMRFVPFIKKSIKWSDIQSVRTVNYGFVGGWGIRLWTRFGTVYNIRGNRGLAIQLKNGEKFLIGTQKEMELNEVLKKLNSSNLSL